MSLLSSTIQQPDYIYCQRHSGGNHELNILCLNPNCSQRGPICYLCAFSEPHISNCSQRTVPFRLIRRQEAAESVFSENLSKCIQQHLDNITLVKNSIVEILQGYETEILNSFEASKTQKDVKSESLLDKFHKGEFYDEEDFRASISKLMKDIKKVKSGNSEEWIYSPDNVDDAEAQTAISSYIFNQKLSLEKIKEFLVKIINKKLTVDVFRDLRNNDKPMQENSLDTIQFADSQIFLGSAGSESKITPAASQHRIKSIPCNIGLDEILLSAKAQQPAESQDDNQSEDASPYFRVHAWNPDEEKKDVETPNQTVFNREEGEITWRLNTEKIAENESKGSFFIRPIDVSNQQNMQEGEPTDKSSEVVSSPQQISETGYEAMRTEQESSSQDKEESLDMRRNVPETITAGIHHSRGILSFSVDDSQSKRSKESMTTDILIETPARYNKVKCANYVYLLKRPEKRFDALAFCTKEEEIKLEGFGLYCPIPIDGNQVKIRYYIFEGVDEVANLRITEEIFLESKQDTTKCEIGRILLKMPVQLEQNSYYTIVLQYFDEVKMMYGEGQWQNVGPFTFAAITKKVVKHWLKVDYKLSEAEMMYSWQFPYFIYSKSSK